MEMQSSCDRVALGLLHGIGVVATGVEFDDRPSPRTALDAGL